MAPHGQNCVLSAIYLRNLGCNRVTLPSPADIRQAMCYVPDWARAAVALAEMRKELGRFEDILDICMQSDLNRLHFCVS